MAINVPPGSRKTADGAADFRRNTGSDAQVAAYVINLAMVLIVSAVKNELLSVKNSIKPAVITIAMYGVKNRG